MHDFFIIISGPTGVGKTEFVNKLSVRLPFPVEIINVDVGQFYTPLSIGTAKPAYQQEPIKHHFFDIISQPRDFTVAEFRKRLIELMTQLWSRGVTPLLVGGSGFYVQSIFFPPAHDAVPTGTPPIKIPTEFKEMSSLQLWQHLHTIDPVRAESLYPQDRYRVERALTLWYLGSKPSLLVPRFDPPGSCAFYFLTRERSELYDRINKRVMHMLNAGWVDEVAGLSGEWKEFLLRKKLIGYPALIHMLEKNLQGEAYTQELAHVAAQIQSDTRAYAKRQLTYWRMLKKKVQEADQKNETLKKIEEIDLTISPLDLYLEQIAKELSDIKALSQKHKDAKQG